MLVLGGTGKTGRRVAAKLAALGVPAAVASRRPGAGRVRFDWTDPASWAPALKGVRAVYVVDSEGPDAPEQVRAFGRLAAELGVERLVLLSARTWSELPDPDGTLLATERAVRDAGPEWTILRPSWFAQNFTEAEWLAPLLAEGELRLPAGEGREPFLDLDDLADVAVAALTEEGHAGRVYDLTGPRALTFHEVVAEISRASGRTVTYTPVTDDEFRTEMAGRGLPAEVTEVLIQLYGHIGRDGSAKPGDGVREALGREPREFADYAGRADFAGPGTA